MKRLSLRTAANWALPLIVRVAWLIAGAERLWRRKRDPRDVGTRVLFLTQNTVAADHARAVAEIFEDDDSFRCYAVNDRVTKSQLSNRDIQSLTRMPSVNIIWALFRDWDLMICVNHPWGMGVWFPPFVRKIYINHGIWAGKINNQLGEDGVYGPSRTNRPRSSPMYDLMFTSSVYEKEYAARCNPALTGRLVVVGSLKGDAILASQQTRRHQIRREKGFKHDDIVVHIMSTWGSSSLFQTVGEQLLAEAAKLRKKYRFVFSLHPRHDEFGDREGRRRKDVLERVIKMGMLVNGGADWGDYIVAADIAVSDHTSLSLYYAVLGKPLIFVPVSSTEYVEGAGFAYVMKRSTTIEDPASLGEKIEEARMKCGRGCDGEILEKLLSFPGEAVNRHREAIYRILKRSNAPIRWSRRA